MIRMTVWRLDGVFTYPLAAEIQGVSDGWHGGFRDVDGRSRLLYHKKVVRKQTLGSLADSAVEKTLKDNFLVQVQMEKSRKTSGMSFARILVVEFADAGGLPELWPGSS